MTFGTIRRYSLFCKLPLVIIGMAIGATAVADMVGKLRFMAFFTIHRPVFVFQLEIGLVMVEGGQRFNDMEGLFVVAFCAIHAEFAVVDIFVAVCAGSKSNTGKFRELTTVFSNRFVALTARCFRVFSPQRKFGVVVVELCGGLELLKIVTLFAIGRKRFLVVIFMAVQTIRIQAEESVFPLFNFIVCDKIRFMAFFASQFLMGSLQLVAGKRMIEILLIETDHFKVSAMVVAVAGGTGFPADIFRNMITPVPVNLIFERRVAVEALFVGHFFAQFMALGTV